MRVVNTILLCVILIVVALDILLNTLDRINVEERFKRERSYVDGRFNEEHWKQECP